jgi:predicted permease
LRIQGGLVVSQIGVALILMIGVGLLYRSLSAIDGLEKGIDPDNLLTLRIDLPATRYASPAAAAAFYERLVDGILQSPGVRAVGTINRLPILDRELTSTMTVEGQAAPRDGQLPWAARTIVSPQYRETMRIPLMQGRDLKREDSAGATRVALISQFMANRYWPGQTAVGKRIRFEEPNTDETWIEIVGVIGDVRNSDADAGPLPQVYIPFSQSPQRTMAVVIRTERNPEQASSGVRAAVAALDKDQPIFDLATMERVLYDDLASNFILMGILIALAGIALMLAAAGIYGVIAYIVAQRTAEIGLRMALGANSTMILRMILRRGLALLLVGASLGLVGGYLLGRLMSSFLYQVAPSDPGTYFSVFALLLIATFAGCCVPALRAARVDPMVALRHQS